MAAAKKAGSASTPASTTARATAPSTSSSKKPVAVAGPSSTPRFPLSSVLVLLVAVAIAAFAVLKPSEFQSLVERSKTRILIALDEYKTVASAPSGFDCGAETRAFLTDEVPVKGFHVLCVTKTPLDTLQVTAFKNGNFANETLETAIDFASFKLALEHALEIDVPDTDAASKSLAATYKQPYAFFTPDGERLDVLSAIVSRRVVYLFEGGQFIWPGIRIGHKTTIKNVHGKGDIEMTTLSLVPLVFEVDDFLKDDEIDVILELSMDHLAPSGVTHIDGHEGRPATDWRTSTTYFLSSTKHALLRDIDQRTADVTKVPVAHQEDVQVLRYEATQKYDQHTDYFPVEHHKNAPSVLEMIEHGYKNRMITVFWYMSDVAAGGHTIFPRAGGAPQPPVMNDCSKGLKVPPKKRKVVIFYSMLATGEGDPMSLHGGCPVEDGIKYSGNKWVWNKPLH